MKLTHKFCEMTPEACRKSPALAAGKFRLRAKRSSKIRMIRGIGMPTNQKEEWACGLPFTLEGIIGWICGARCRRGGRHLLSRQGWRKTLQ